MQLPKYLWYRGRTALLWAPTVDTQARQSHSVYSHHKQTGHFSPAIIAAFPTGSQLSHDKFTLLISGVHMWQNGLPCSIDPSVPQFLPVSRSQDKCYWLKLQKKEENNPDIGMTQRFLPVWYFMLDKFWKIWEFSMGVEFVVPEDSYQPRSVRLPLNSAP